jgi:hypothetical protein
MDIEQALLEQIRSLTLEQQQQVLDFAAFLRHRQPAQTNRCIPGLHQDVPYWIADDFDAPLPDAFWLGEV